MEFGSPSQGDDTIDNVAEHIREYFQEILIDKKKLKQIQKEGFSLSDYSGFKVNLLDRIGIRPRKHHLYYGHNICERALEVDLTSNKVMIPLLTRKDIQSKLNTIKPDIRNTLGWIHIGAIQIIIRSTFKEGLDTPLEMAIVDNRIINREEACLGVLKGNLQYGKIKFNIYPRIAYHLSDRDFDKTLSLIQDFKRKDFFRSQNRPYSITYIISYAISNTHHSDCFVVKDTIDLPCLFNDICQIQIPSLPKITELDSLPLNLDLQDKPIITTNRIPNRLSFTNTGVTSIPLSRTYSSRNLIESTNSEVKNYKIEAEYYNGIQYEPVKILIDTGANGNYISHKLCQYLARYKLDIPHRYTNFNGDTHEINEAVETKIKFKLESIPIRLLIENEGINDTLEIMLGVTFLESVKPYKITSYGLKITYNNKMIYIPK